MPIDAGSPAAAVPRAGSAERFFQWSLYLLLVTGFVALMGTNKLDLPSLALVLPPLLLRAYLLLIHKEFILSERWTTYLTIVYFAFYAADYFYFSRSFIEATVHLVLFGMVFKIFSVRRDRDLVYLVVLSFLLVLAAAVLTVDTLFLLTFALFILVAMATFISMEMRRSEREAQATPVPQRQDGRFYRSLAGAAAILGVLTLAGSALIFFILPRLNSGGYLSGFGVQSSMITGFGQDVRLGGIGQIQQSDAVVMHVQVLTGGVQRDVKWRGVALASFDGQRWWNGGETPSFHRLNNWPLDLTQASKSAFYSGTMHAPLLPTLTYRVVMEPIGLNVFFLAPVPVKINGHYRILEITPDGAVFNASAGAGDASIDAENAQRIGAYTAEADTRDPEPWVRNSNSNDYPPRVSSLYLQLPSLDPRILELAQRTTASSVSNYARAQAIESYLKTNFGYTLELPGGKSADPLAYFLFTRKKGHCEYFASSMTVMLRTLGIPARLVNGFRGGEFNSLTGSYIVRQKHAHSWVEAYFPEFGWVTFDPTPGGPTESSAGGWSRVALYMDAVQEMWREWIIDYDFSHQVRLSNELSATSGKAQSSFRLWLMRRYRMLVNYVAKWQRRLEQMSPAQMAISCVLLALFLALPFAPKAWRSLQRVRMQRDPHRAPKSTASFWYLRMLKRLDRRGIRKAPSQTPEEFSSSIADPQVREDVVVFTQHYERARFAESIEDAERLPQLYEEIAGKK